jgi:nicotinate-nucleotide adenylyltransferase
VPGRSGIGVLGGTFDPIHVGHLAAAGAVAERLGLDRVIFVPTGQPWMKAVPPQAGPAERLRMVELAISHDPRFEVSSVDIDRPGPTYAVDTMADLQACHAGQPPGQPVEWYFIVGVDALAGFMRWREPARLLTMTRLVAVTRPGHERPTLPLPPEAVELVVIPPVDVSSTAIRALVAEGRPITGMVAPAVEQYIAARGLYRGSRAGHHQSGDGP